MSLVAASELYRSAEEEDYALGAYDACGGQIDIIETTFQAAEEMHSPVIISDGYVAIKKYFGLEYFSTIVKMRAARSSVPVVLHLDHALEFEYVIQAIKCGFTSVMFDGSRLPYEKNIEVTRKIVQVAHSVGVSVEAEIGNIGGVEGDPFSSTNESLYTDPDIAKDFVHKTGIDSLAPAIGNVHGFYSKEPKLDFERLRDIKKKTNIPLVLHGATGIPINDIKKAITLGIRKVNLATIVHHTYVEGIKEYIETHPGENRNLLRGAREPLKELIKEQIKAFGSTKGTK
jgi:ketose-bisphosphate aldolase